MVKKPTLKDIAYLAHVSPATVSRALNHRSSVNIETLQVIDEAMEKLGYTLEKKDPGIIMIHLEELDNIYFYDVLAGVNAAANARNLHVLIDQTPLNPETIPDFVRRLETVHATGLITMHQLPVKILEKLSKVIRVVQCSEHNPDASLPFVTIDNYQAAKQATNYLIQAGKTRLCLLNGSLDNRYAIQRQKGFIDAMQIARLPIRKDWIVSLNDIRYDLAIPIIESLLNTPKPPDAFFCISDTIGAAVISVANKYHLSIPEDVAVLGFDNTFISKMTTPALSTVDVPKFQEGYTAVDLLFQKQIKNVLLKTSLVIRDSV
ncbi:LacI family DNA-binding transcriptional regulator [Mitsuokella multacida]|uniref:LacI family DNA-binding transcriptional regulator n=1 Tax=Mitsuokella multacida TaxID=52226 RepID=UPI003F802ED2